MSDTVYEKSSEIPENQIVSPQSPLDKILQFFTIKIAQALINVSWITPNGITWTSLLIGGFLASFLILKNYYLWAVLAIVISGLLDCLDGDLARSRGIASDTGNLLDSVLDRYVDFLIISALILGNPRDNLVVGLIALLGTTMVPYIRAKSESLGRSSIASIGSRAVRTVLIIIGLLTGQIFPLLIALAVISNVAAIHRFAHALNPGNE
ncbi:MULTISPECIES: CDP-alcohol phosphatidyltransferase family protein [Arthrospira]|uniref:CDP-alcohol phosphatidyltransferase family protein n=1 Tax=Limnospira platensis NIES-46 TaxID=1236695 RepID=A0A5M3T691_LIMPL|nr:MULTISPECIES: CDP-alcohol phosphatidyltransferase family protein [Arthrospira]AMW29068.1 CDP-alcohol phosphatidyltransferase [Arthrospira platensis YZ]KDR55042.1 CDP-alcohol phosphatidyltransferase [Arthrospira platensis str. Paraca]MBD2667808.1 CDP-alcohol phosphatidyltransferase family protein [Arthrospira platensis FACHB-439]MBD2708619.1 CDP-alcohol phosphatidyltransferase family protein [Arthrospira platensis FACHB-835]MDF2212894.1 CDP-alcohol phosphatidyltransferase family protein [Art